MRSHGLRQPGLGWRSPGLGLKWIPGVLAMGNGDQTGRGLHMETDLDSLLLIVGSGHG